MVVKKYILKTLNSLELRFNEALRSPVPQDSVYFSKLCVLEYCGWIEETFDLIVRRSVKGKLKSQEFKQILDNTVIGNNFGFEYKKHFRTMLIKAAGLTIAEKIEKHLKDTNKFDIFISELNNIKTHRDSAAHTWIDGPTRTYPAPSDTKARFEIVYPIMKSVYTQIVNLT